MRSITCPACGRTSYHPVDVMEGYCGHCHAFTSPKLAERRAMTSDELEKLNAGTGFALPSGLRAALSKRTQGRRRS